MCLGKQVEVDASTWVLGTHKGKQQRLQLLASAWARQTYGKWKKSCVCHFACQINQSLRTKQNHWFWHRKIKIIFFGSSPSVEIYLEGQWWKPCTDLGSHPQMTCPVLYLNFEFLLFAALSFFSMLFWWVSGVHVWIVGTLFLSSHSRVIAVIFRATCLKDDLH